MHDKYEFKYQVTICPEALQIIEDTTKQSLIFLNKMGDIENISCEDKSRMLQRFTRAMTEIAEEIAVANVKFDLTKEEWVKDLIQSFFGKNDTSEFVFHYFCSEEKDTFHDDLKTLDKLK